ncbi:hypothetical protein I4U23_027729 [Adineta vaga]|nr:hypothetical protein I4U23_027729 [Adineta vaga]
MSGDMGGVLQFLLYVGQAKRTFRTGWVLRGVEKVESVADHMYRMAVMSLLLPNISEESKTRCMKLALVHDLAESVVGDLTEFDGVQKNEKHRREGEAMLYLTSLLPADVGREIFSLFNEYSEQKTNEANLVKDLDIFDMLLQAFEYEKLQCNDGFLEDFFQSSASKVKTDIVQKWLEQLMKCRSLGGQFQLPADSNLNTMLKHVLYDEQGTFLHKLPSNELREKSDRFISSLNKDESSTSVINTNDLLTNLVKGFQH